MKSPANNVTCQKWPYFKSISKVFKHHALKLLLFDLQSFSPWSSPQVAPLVLLETYPKAPAAGAWEATRSGWLPVNQNSKNSDQKEYTSIEWVLVNLMSSLLPPQHPWHPNLIGWISGVNLEASPKLVSPLHIHIQRNTFQYIIIKYHLPT